MPPSHQRHRRSPFERTSFRRTSSGSSSLRSFSEIQSHSPTTPQLSNLKISGWENGNVVIRNVDTDKHSVSFHPTVTVTICQDEMAATRKEDGDTSQSQPQFQILRCENIKGGIEGKDTSLASSSIYSTDTLGYPTTDPDEDADNGSYASCSSIPTVPELSLETLTSRSKVSVSDASVLNAPGEDDGELGVSMANSRMQRWKTLGSRRTGNGDGVGEKNESRNGNGKGNEKREKRIRPFLRKYCLHPFSMRSSFRLVGWIEDPVGCCVGHGAAYGTGYAYGGGIGDARLWDEARRSGWEGGLY
ncbi:uncharacterized protein Bfra_008586 [Botrytis fragariae]|uniref:Uncharacterized protein n=1 Tax=Botrytis fragariae TaxID=1964551 RepID=A0A8H6ATV7_9HELO|nr:uncharacterized protein Bfra_008586 [Botrytis fragariae]KAF5873305.1 hypothetical protein Bfra_008586 [Botrytis fragariae]